MNWFLERWAVDEEYVLFDIGMKFDSCSYFISFFLLNIKCDTTHVLRTYFFSYRSYSSLHIILLHSATAVYGCLPLTDVHKLDVPSAWVFTYEHLEL